MQALHPIVLVDMDHKQVESIMAFPKKLQVQVLRPIVLVDMGHMQVEYIVVFTKKL